MWFRRHTRPLLRSLQLKHVVYWKGKVVSGYGVDGYGMIY